MVQRDYIANKSRPKKNDSLITPKLMSIVATFILIFVATIIFFITKKSDVEKPVEIAKPKINSPAEALPEQPQERWAYLKELETPNSAPDSAIEKDLSPSLKNSPTFDADDLSGTNQPQNQGVASAKTVEPDVAPKVVKPPKNVVEDKPEKKVKTETKTEVKADVKTKSKPATGNTVILQCGAFKNKANADGIKATLAMSGVASNVVYDKLYLVVVGPYDTREIAAQTLESLKNSGITNCVIKIK